MININKKEYAERYNIIKFYDLIFRADTALTPTDIKTKLFDITYLNKINLNNKDYRVFRYLQAEGLQVVNINILQMVKYLFPTVNGKVYGYTAYKKAIFESLEKLLKAEFSVVEKNEKGKATKTIKKITLIKSYTVNGNDLVVVFNKLIDKFRFFNKYYALNFVNVDSPNYTADNFRFEEKRKLKSEAFHKLDQKVCLCIYPIVAYRKTRFAMDLGDMINLVWSNNENKSCLNYREKTLIESLDILKETRIIKDYVINKENQLIIFPSYKVGEKTLSIENTL